MASVDKVKISDTTYDVSPSATGTLNGYTSGDSASPSSWSSVDVVSTSDTNSSIFNKITTMVKNVRWLYTKLGSDDFSDTGSDTITGALSILQSGLDGKSPSSHTHTTMTLPVSSNQVNSENYVPTSALLYSMVQRANDIANSIQVANDIINRDDPNTRYESKDLGTWSSTSDVDTFMSKYNHDSNYAYGGVKLSLGNYVTIQDGKYNAVWEIAGFDMESHQTAADGTAYDNGYGICMIPKTYVTTGAWGIDNTTNGGYKSSYMHNTVLPGIVTNLNTVLGNHIVNRIVLLSSSSGSNDYSDAYTWTTADATLMSVGQMTGTFASYRNKYDDGEANYKLPLFNYENYWTSSSFWTRGVAYDTGVWSISSDGRIYNNVAGDDGNRVRPLIYLR